ncbi:FecR family protein [Methylophilus sp. OH31]|uniref:FecR family protein n=1 Tax=Methylophilus sp. OH31 TaxID=1387312 RepID=UPI00046539FF|nr:FecR family protein [Methylophilus sp. OH31]
MVKWFSLMQHTTSSPDIILQAAEWHTHLHADHVSEADRIAFAQWLASDARHATAFTQMEKLWSRFDAAQETSSKRALNAVLKPSKHKRNKVFTTGLCLLAVMLVGSMVVNSLPARVMLADYHTGIGEQRTIELADHSQMTLDTHSAVNIHFNAGQRRVELLQGKILLQVAKDAQRPFVVETAEGTARALGTQYTVGRQHHVTQVMVIESSVEACTVQRSCVTLSPGEATLLQNDLPASKTNADIQNETAWISSRLVADDLPLSLLLSELQRYHQGHLYYDAAALAHVHVSGVFALNDTARTLKVLADTTPVTMTHYTPWLTSIQPAH